MPSSATVPGADAPSGDRPPETLGAAGPLVVMLTNDRGIDRRITLQADALEQAGWRVVIIGMPLDPGMQDSDQRVVRIGAGRGHGSREAVLLGSYRWLRRRLAINSVLMRSLRTLAWRTVIDPERFYLNLFGEIVLRYQPRVLIAHDLPMLAVAAAAARMQGAKLVYDSHELYTEQELTRRERRRWREIESAYIGTCDMVITINPSIAQELQRRYGLGHVEVISNADRATGLPHDEGRLRRTFQLAPTDRVLLFQGGLSGGRNLDGLVRAMSMVGSIQVKLVILGDGYLRGTLMRMVKTHGLEGRVYLHPAVPQSELIGVSAGADAGIIPYQATCLNNYYCTPNKLFEFIAAGIPILANDLPEIRRVVAGQAIGLVGAMKSPAEMANLIDQFFADEERLRNWKSRLAQVRAELCWEAEAPRLQGLFERLR